MSALLCVCTAVFNGLSQLAQTVLLAHMLLHFIVDVLSPLCHILSYQILIRPGKKKSLSMAACLFTNQDFFFPSHLVLSDTFAVA